MTYICVGNLTTIGSDNGLSPDRRQAIIWTNAGILLIGPLWTNFSEISIKSPTFSFKKMRLKVTSAKWWPFFLGLNVLILLTRYTPGPPNLHKIIYCLLGCFIFFNKFAWANNICHSNDFISFHPINQTLLGTTFYLMPNLCSVHVNISSDINDSVTVWFKYECILSSWKQTNDIWISIRNYHEVNSFSQYIYID